MNKIKKRTTRLGRDVSIAAGLFIVCICICMGCIGYVPYYRNMHTQYNTYIGGILNYVEGEIDGDKLETYLDAGGDLLEYPATKEIFADIKKTQDIFEITLEELDPDEPDTDGIDYYYDKYDGNYVYSGAVSIRNSDHKELCYLVVEIEVSGMKTSIVKYGRAIAIAAVINAIIFFVNFYIWIRKRVLKPIKKLNSSAQAFVQSGRETKNPDELVLINPEIHSHDEVRQLSDSLEEMALDVQQAMKNLMAETKEKESIASELRIAAQIQASMLPCIFPPFPDRPEIDIYASMNPAKEVGGDFYDFFMLDENRLGFVVADVSGKGVPAALFMVIGKTLIKDYSGFGKDLGEVFTKVNNLLCESNTSGLFITAFEGILDLKTGELEFVNAGHEKPFIYHKNEDKWELYPTRAGFVLAGMEDMRYRSGKMKLEKGDRIFLYTDGVTEAANKNDEQYGKDRLEKALNESGNLDAEHLIASVRKDVDKFADGREQFDDITMLCLEFK